MTYAERGKTGERSMRRGVPNFQQTELAQVAILLSNTRIRGAFHRVMERLIVAVYTQKLTLIKQTIINTLPYARHECFTA